MNVISKRELNEDDILKLKFLSRESRKAKKEAKQKYGKNAPKPDAKEAYNQAVAAPNMNEMNQMTPAQKNALIEQARQANYPVPQNTTPRVTALPFNAPAKGTETNVPLPEAQKVALPTNANTPAEKTKAKQQQEQQAAQKRKQLLAQAEKLIAEGEAYAKQGDTENHDYRIAQVKQILASLKA